ncbi:alpha-amylase [Chryseobacterium sp. Alg-005]|uniref:alpha-amylase n=1 Tax=Chryseobacterium sp. Alg-005 TaxID=3159516 RepID=UPI00355570E3
MNGTIIQFFHWYHPANLWKEFIEQSEYLKNLGFTAVWFPPANKCDLGIEGRGYDVYDLYDLGEFDQKDGIPTRYGTKEEYLNAIKKAQESGMSVYADIVLNHRMGGDEMEEITIHRVNEENRNEMLGEPFTANAFTKFTFPGRNGKYSEFIWDHQCFSGIDVIHKDEEEIKGVFKIHNEYGTEWNAAVSHQFGNYDYLMGADVEYRNPHVVQELKNWIKWYLDVTKVNGIRLDALKHISSDFLKDWISYIKTEIDPNCFVLGEFWKDEAGKISDFFDRMDNLLSCFDAPLHYNFFTASREGKDYDLTKILENTFLKDNPLFSVSFVENHDTQQFQSLESAVGDWFKPMAYAIILLSKEAYPCVFYPDLYGAEYTEIQDDKEVNVTIPKVETLPALLQVRQQFAYGEQIDYFDHSNCIAWVRTGDHEHSGCVVVISNSEEGYKEIELGAEHAHAQYTDFLHQRSDTVTLDENGKGVFLVNSKSVSVWTKQ